MQVKPKNTTREEHLENMHDNQLRLNLNKLLYLRVCFVGLMFSQLICSRRSHCSIYFFFLHWISFIIFVEFIIDLIVGLHEFYTKWCTKNAIEVRTREKKRKNIVAYWCYRCYRFGIFIANVALIVKSIVNEAKEFSGTICTNNHSYRISNFIVGFEAW